jgi:hypothetical protein
MIPQLALHLIAGLIHPDHELCIFEEELETIDLDEDCDLVGISCMTSNANRAYVLAREYRKRGRSVVLGGVRPTLLPEEALRHCDAVVVGEAEGVWEQVVGDAEAVRKIKDHGIYFHASMIFGFDSDTKEAFADTLDFLEKNRISSASINVLAPYPGTEVFRSFKEDGRLLSEDWRYADHSTIVFQPKNMSPFELQAGRLWVMKQFTRMSSMLRRLPANLDFPLPHLAMNLGFQSACRHELRELSELASRLFPVPENQLSEQRGIPLRGMRVTDLLACGLLRPEGTSEA